MTDSSSPNILVLLCDQLQHSRMGFVDGVAHTPHLDSLAGEGIHFTHAITAHGQCVPSRAVFMTGQSPHECGVMVNYGFFGHGNKLTRSHNTIAKVLRNDGYDTAFFGKGHLGSPLSHLGFDHGRVYDDYELSDAEAARLGCQYVRKCISTDYKAAEDAVKFLRDYPCGQRPLFFMFSTNFPHPPFFAERRFIDLFPPEKMPIPDSYDRETFQGKPPFQKEHACDGTHGAGSETEMRRMLAQYYSMIAAMDEHMGRVIAEFKRLGLWDNTIVLFTADHGDMMGAHRMVKKGTLPYDELYRVPCVFKLSQNSPPPPRTTVDDLVSSQAFPGTLLRLTGREVPESFTGGHFADAFVRPDRPPDNEHVFFEHYAAYWGIHPFYGVRTRDRKYVRYYGEDDTEELYDLLNDPDELCNVVENPQYASDKAKLSALADNWWEDTNGRDLDYYESDDFKANLHNR